MTGNKPRRGLADFLSRELKAQPAAVPAEEVRSPVTTRVAEDHPPKGPRRMEPAPTPAVTVAPGPATASQGAAQALPEALPEALPVAPPRGPSATTSQTREIRKDETHRVPDDETPAAASSPREVTKSVTPEVRESAPEGATAAARTGPRTAEVSKPRTDRVDDAEEGSAEDPLYLRLTRKEVRFRDEQMEGLHRLARRLSKARRGMKGDRITDNTLVRVAVDLLLQHGDDLTGHDEATLLESLRRLGRKRG